MGAREAGGRRANRSGGAARICGEAGGGRAATVGQLARRPAGKPSGKSSGTAVGRQRRVAKRRAKRPAVGGWPSVGEVKRREGGGGRRRAATHRVPRRPLRDFSDAFHEAPLQPLPGARSHKGVALRRFDLPAAAPVEALRDLEDGASSVPHRRHRRSAHRRGGRRAQKKARGRKRVRAATNASGCSAETSRNKDGEL